MSLWCWSLTNRGCMSLEMSKIKSNTLVEGLCMVFGWCHLSSWGESQLELLQHQARMLDSLTCLVPGSSKFPRKTYTSAHHTDSSTHQCKVVKSIWGESTLHPWTSSGFHWIADYFIVLSNNQGSCKQYPDWRQLCHCSVLSLYKMIVVWHLKT